MMSTSNTHGAIAFVLILLGLFAAFEALTVWAMVRIVTSRGAGTQGYGRPGPWGYR